MSVLAIIEQVVHGISPVSLINEKIDPGQINKIKNLKPNDKLIVYHGTSKVYLPRMINGFDAAKQEMSRHYGGPRHVGLFVSPDIDVAERFSNYGELILELEVRAKNLHGTDYSGNVYGKKDDEIMKDQFPNSFRPGLSSLMLSTGTEPQALLLGMVSPKQIKRIRWAEGYKGPMKWYTRSELLKKGFKVKGQPGSGYGEFSLDDWGIDLSSTKIPVPKFFDAVAKHVGKDSESVIRVIKAWASVGENNVYEKLRDTFHFGTAAARALAKKLVAHKFESHDPVSLVLQGKDPRDLVNELTTSAVSIGYKIPKPMGIVKKTRKKDQEAESIYEDLLERAFDWLLERKRAPTLIMYHGTTTKFLREILKKGLIPNPKMGVWKDDEDAARYTSQETRRSIPGVYFASNFMTAVSAGGNAKRKFGGTYLFVAAQLQPRHAYADEDTVKIKLEKALVRTLGVYNEDPSLHWFEGVGLSKWKQWGTDVAKELAMQLTASALPFGLGQKGAKVPPDPEGCTDVVKGWVEQAAAKTYAREGDKWLKSHMFRTKSDYATLDAPEDKKQLVFDTLKKEMPSVVAAENLYLKGLEKLSKRYKGLAMLAGGDTPGGFSNWFTHTLRMPEPVTYSGRNKILAVFQTMTKSDVNYIIQHYGKVTPQMISDMKRSSWLSGKEDKIITQAEAKKLGLEGV